MAGLFLRTFISGRWPRRVRVRQVGGSWTTSGTHATSYTIHVVFEPVPWWKVWAKP